MFLLIYYSNSLYWVLAVCWASLMAQMIKNLPAVQETKVEGRFFTIWAIWVRKIPWRRKWQPAPVFLPGEFYGQRSLLGYSPWDCKESDTSELITLCCILDTRIFKNEQHLHPACYHVRRNVQWKYETGKWVEDQIFSLQTCTYGEYWYISTTCNKQVMFWVFSLESLGNIINLVEIWPGNSFVEL